MHAGTSSQQAWQVSLREYAAADPSSRIRMLLSAPQDPDIEADRGVLKALLGALSPAERADKAAAIMGDLAADRLPWCASLVRAECFHRQVRLLSYYNWAMCTMYAPDWHPMNALMTIAHAAGEPERGTRYTLVACMPVHDNC